MKTLLKILGGLLIGIVAGLVIAAVMIVLFTDQTFSEFIENMQSTAVPRFYCRQQWLWYRF